MPLTKLSGPEHDAYIDGSPSNTITLSAKYVAIMKSCSTIKALLLVFKIHLFMTLAARTLCSESK